MAEPLSSVDVLVRKSIMRNATSVEICRTKLNGNYICGNCCRGNLGDIPRLHQRCKVCGAVVIQGFVITDKSSRTSAAGMGARRDGRALRVKGAKASKRAAVTQTSAAPGSSGPADLMRE